METDARKIRPVDGTEKIQLVFWSGSAADERAKGMAMPMGMTEELGKEKAEVVGDDNKTINDGMEMKEEALWSFRRWTRARRCSSTGAGGGARWPRDRAGKRIGAASCRGRSRGVG